MSGSSGGYCPICGKSYGPGADCCPVHGFLFQSRDALRPGVVIDGAYEILQRLGAGGMGETYLVRHAFLGENLVLKRIRPELAEDPLYQQSFLREAHSLVALRKLTAVVEIRNAWQTREGYLALLLEYVEGGNLVQWLDTLRGGGPLEPLEAVAIAADLARVLAAAHAIGVLHRDGKPQNILMRQLEDGGFQLKLCDFGLAVQRMEEMTRQGTTTTRLGTPGYAAPEQYTLSSREQDARVDVFGLGMTLYRLAAGRLPWEASAASWPLVCTDQRRKSLKELRPALGREYWLENLLFRLTAVERNDRIATAAEALELMQEALAETRPAPALAVKPEPRVPPPIEAPPPPPLGRAPEVAATEPATNAEATETEVPVDDNILSARVRSAASAGQAVPLVRPAATSVTSGDLAGAAVESKPTLFPDSPAVSPDRAESALQRGAGVFSFLPSRKMALAASACTLVLLLSLVWWTKPQHSNKTGSDLSAQAEQTARHGVNSPNPITPATPSSESSTSTNVDHASDAYPLVDKTALLALQATSRFSIAGSTSAQTVFDKKFGLMWTRKDYLDLEGRLPTSWEEAMNWAKKLNAEGYAGYSDWAVPSIGEYRTINSSKADREEYARIFDETAERFFWSRNTPTEYVASWISFADGYAASSAKGLYESGIPKYGRLNNHYSVRLVRKP